MIHSKRDSLAFKNRKNNTCEARCRTQLTTQCRCIYWGTLPITWEFWHLVLQEWGPEPRKVIGQFFGRDGGPLAPGHKGGPWQPLFISVLSVFHCSSLSFFNKRKQKRSRWKVFTVHFTHSILFTSYKRKIKTDLVSLLFLLFSLIPHSPNVSTNCSCALLMAEKQPPWLESKKKDYVLKSGVHNSTDFL